MLLYHSTLNGYSPGDLIVASTPTPFYLEAVAELEGKRPPDRPSRSTCLFATDDLAFCYFFALRQQRDPSQIKIYEVEMDTYHQAPFAIVHWLQKRIQGGGALGRLTSEYWNPAEPWKFWEFFGPTMTVSRQVGAPAINQVMMLIKYQTESDRASSL
jgi:hypothetical protein